MPVRVTKIRHSLDSKEQRIYWQDRHTNTCQRLCDMGNTALKTGASNQVSHSISVVAWT